MPRSSVIGICRPIDSVLRPVGKSGTPSNAANIGKPSMMASKVAP